MNRQEHHSPGRGRFEEAALRVFHDARDLCGAVAGSVAGFMKEFGADCLEAGDVLVDIIAGTLDAVASIGRDAADAARGIALGALRGSRPDPGSAFTTLAMTSRSVVRHVGRAGGDIAAATRGLVAGAAEGAREIGIDVSEAVFAVSRGALQGAREFGTSAAEEVREAAKAMRQLTRGREPGTSTIDEMEDTPLCFPGRLVD
jgi:hypothetical protein